VCIILVAACILSAATLPLRSPHWRYYSSQYVLLYKEEKTSGDKTSLDSNDVELTEFKLRDVPSETTAVIYDVCSHSVILHIHLRRGGGTTLRTFFNKGVVKKQCKKSVTVQTVEAYLHIFKLDHWSLEEEFGQKDPTQRPLSVINLRDPMMRLWSLYNFEFRYKKGYVGFHPEHLPTDSSPVWINNSPQEFFTWYPDNFYVRVLCCKGDQQLIGKVGANHLSRAMEVLEHEFGVITILEWYMDPRFQHYLYSTLNISKEVKPFECYVRSYAMQAGQKDLLGVIQFVDPVFVESWKKLNSLDYELFRYAQKLVWRRVLQFWNESNGKLLPVDREPRSLKFPIWTEELFQSRVNCDKDKESQRK